MSNEHRDKIKKSNVLNALIEHAEGNREMTSSQVTASLGLLKKCFPDLQSVDNTSSDGSMSLPEKIKLVAEKNGSDDQASS